MVDYGHSSNLKAAADRKQESDERKIIVSRSHAGPVETVAMKSFGENTKVVPAGGAGEWREKSENEREKKCVRKREWEEKEWERKEMSN